MDFAAYRVPVFEEDLVKKILDLYGETFRSGTGPEREKVIKWINKNLHIAGFTHAGNAPYAKIREALVVKWKKSNLISVGFVQAWLSSELTLYESVAYKIDHGEGSDTVEELLTLFDNPPKDIQVIMDAGDRLVEELDLIKDREQLPSARLVVMYCIAKRRYERDLQNNDRNTDAKEVEPYARQKSGNESSAVADEKGDEDFSAFDGLVQELKEFITSRSMAFSGWPRMQRELEEVLRILTERRESADQQKAFSHMIERFFKDNEAILSYVSKKVSLPAPAVLLEVNDDERRGIGEKLEHAGRILSRISDFRTKVAEDTQYLENLNESIAELTLLVSTMRRRESDEPPANKPAEPVTQAAPEEVNEVIPPLRVNDGQEKATEVEEIEQKKQEKPDGETESVPPEMEIVEECVSLGQRSSAEIAKELVACEGNKDKNVQELVWALVAEGRGGLAGDIISVLPEEQRNSLPPAWLPVSMALAVEVQSDVETSEIASQLERFFHKEAEELLLAIPVGAEVTFSLLITAATVRPSIVAIRSGAPELLRQAYLYLETKYKPIADAAREILAFADNHVSFNIEVAKGAAYWERRRETLVEEAGRWREEAPQRNMKYGPARTLWRIWTQPNGALNRIATIIAEDETARVDEVLDALKKFGTEEKVRIQIERYQSEQRLPSIQAAALRHLCEQTRKLFDVARPWCDLVTQSSSKKITYTVKETEALVRKLKPLLSELQELNRNLKSGELYEAYAAESCRYSFGKLEELFSPEVEIAIPETSLTDAMESHRLYFPEFKDGMVPAKQLPDFLEGIFSVIVEDKWDPQVACIRQSNFRNFENAVRILELAQKNSAGQTVVDEMRNTLRASISQTKEEMERLVAATEAAIEEAVITNLLNETSRADFVDKVGHIKYGVENLSIDQPVDCSRMKNDLEEMAAQISEKKKEMHDKVLSKLDRLKSKNPNSKAKIRELIEKGDFVIAEDYIGRLEQDGDLPQDGKSLSALTDFFPQVAEEIEEYLEHRGLLRFSNDVKARNPIPGIQLKAMTGAHTDRFADAVKAWDKMKFEKAINVESLKTILATFGFLRIHRIDKLPTRGAEWYGITTEVVADRSRCPIPQFGSLTDGHYRLTGLFGRPDVIQIVDLIGDTVVSEPSIVLFFGRLSKVRRRELSELCFEKRKTFILVDELLLAFLAGSQNTMKTLFDCTLPFTFVEPYVTTAGLVPPELFMGRNHEKDSITSPLGSCFIYGGRQLGKTALLRECEKRFHSPVNGRIAVWLDLKTEGIGITREIDTIWQVMAGKMAAYEIFSTRDAASATADKFVRTVSEWLKKDESRRILVLLDEADHFLDRDGRPLSEEKKNIGNFALAARLKGLMDNTKRRFKVVFAGLHNVQRTTRLQNHPLAHYGEPLCIGPLIDNNESRAAEELVKGPLEAIGYSISQDLVHRILAYTNYYPSLIQLFCQELVKFLSRDHTRLFSSNEYPPYTIKSLQIEEAYKSENLRKAIRDRFVWTLQLDVLYEVIAYSMAYKYLFDQEDRLTEGLTVAQIRELCMDWWASGFKEISHDGMQVLLDEMDGLGVLRKSEGKYRFRNGNILRLLGTEAEITDMLLKEHEKRIEFEPSRWRSYFIHKDRLVVSPLMASQLDFLKNHRCDVTAVTISSLINWQDLRMTIERLTEPDPVNSGNLLYKPNPAAFASSIKERLSRTNGRPEVIIFDSDSMPLNVHHLEQAARIAKELNKGESGAIHLVFLIDPDFLWEIMDRDDNSRMLEQLGVRIVSAEKWKENDLQLWIEEQPEYSAGRATSFRESMASRTGLWPSLIYGFDRSFRRKKDWGETAKITAVKLLGQEQLDKISSLMKAIGRDCRGDVLKELLEFGKLQNSEIIEQVSGRIAADEAMKILSWGEMLGFVRRLEKSTWELDEKFGEIWRSLRSQ